MPCVSVEVSSDFCCFKLALPSLLSMSKDEVKAAHSDFDLGPRGGDLRPENPPDRHFSQPQFSSFDMDNSDGKASLKQL